jgi:archaellum biogenesis protein FlaJ (TadC family)
MIADVTKYVEALPWGLKTLLALGVFVLTFVVSLGAVAAVVVRLPANYFREDYVSSLAEQHPIVRWAGVIIKNVLGILLVLLGLFLSLPGIPGQGLLTILIGVMLLSFPGKRRLERRLVSRPSVLAAINALRARFGKPAMRLE